VFDCPLFKTQKIVCTDQKIILLSGMDLIVPVCTLHMKAFALEPKSPEVIA